MKTFFFLLSLILLSTEGHADWKADVLQKALTVYSPIALKTFNKPLEILTAANNSISAHAEHDHTVLRVVVNTGLLASSRLTVDSLRMVVCHELGHLFGKEPRKNIPMEWDGPIAPDGLSYMSAEGQADYYAGQECFKKIAPDADQKRIAEAGLKFLNLVHDFPISISTPDTSVAQQLIRDSYPGRQCRLDTIVLGSKKMARPRCWFP